MRMRIILYALFGLLIAGAVSGLTITKTWTAETLTSGDLNAAFGEVEVAVSSLETSSATHVVGPTSASDEALVRYDGTTGKLVQTSGATLSDTGTLTLPAGGGIVVTASAVNGQSLSMRERSDLGASEVILAVGSTDLSATVEHTFDANGQLSATGVLQDNTVDDALLNITENACYTLFTPGSTIADTYDLTSVWEAFAAVTITRVWCETDTGTANLDVQIDDGTPADVMGADLVCAATGVADTTSLTGTMADGNRLDWAITSVASSPTRLTVCAEYTR